jgi:hypothetical protein
MTEEFGAILGVRMERRAGRRNAAQAAGRTLAWSRRRR